MTQFQQKRQVDKHTIATGRSVKNGQSVFFVNGQLEDNVHDNWKTEFLRLHSIWKKHRVKWKTDRG